MRGTMNRKLVKHGPASTIISLPAQWVQDHKLVAGDTVQLIPDGDKLVVTPTTVVHDSETTLTVDGLDRTGMKLLIRSAYRQGYAKIVIRYTTPTVPHFRKNEDVPVARAVLAEVQLLIGMEVTEQREGHIVIQEMTKPFADDFPNLYRKVFTMVKQFILFLADESDDNHLDVDSRHDLIMKIISYAMRIINLGEANLDSKEKHRMSHTFLLLGITIDMCKYYARSRVGKKISPVEKTFIHGLAELFTAVESCVFSKTPKTMFVFEKQKQALREKPIDRLVPITDVLTDLMVLYVYY